MVSNFFFFLWALPFIQTTIFILQCTTVYVALCPLLWTVELLLLLLLLLQAAPLCNCSSALYCCCCSGLQSCCSFCCRLLLLQGLPLAAPLLLLQILVRTIVFSAVLLSPRIELVSSDHTIGTSQPTTDPARQDLFNRVQ